MDSRSPKDSLLAVLQKGRRPARPPVICPGGMMNAAIVPIMERTGHLLPAAHTNPTLMADLASDVQEHTGFENLGLPFCLTVEAEALGSEITLGTLACEPKVTRERFPNTASATIPVLNPADSPRIATVAAAAHLLAQRHPDLPVVGNVSGPISTTASLVDPMAFLKDLRKDPDNAHRILQSVTDFLLAYARLLLSSGVTVIAIGDPTATGEILGPKMFEAFALPYLNRLVDGIHASNATAIVHICGDLKRVIHLVPQLHSDALSTDALVNLRRLKEDHPNITTMGNLSTYLLQWGDPNQIANRTAQLVDDDIDIISPACGLSTSTPLANIQALTTQVRQGAKGHLQ